MQHAQQVAGGRYGAGGLNPAGLQQQQMGQYGRVPGQISNLAGHPGMALNNLNTTAPNQSGMRGGLGGNIGLGPSLAGAGRPGMERGGSGAQSTLLTAGNTGVNTPPGGGLIGVGSGANQTGLNLSGMNGPGRIGGQTVNQLGGQLGNLSIQNSPLRTGAGTVGVSGLPGVGGGLVNPSGALHKGVGQHPEFSIQKEDFPALPSNSGTSFAQLGGDELSGLAGSFHHTLQSQSGNGAPGTGYEQQLLYSQQQQQLQQQQQGGGVPGIAGGTGKAAAGGPDRFGLLGLLSVIRMTDPDLTTLALGTDLTTLGLNLNSPENLYKTFTSPWADGPGRPEPEFTTPGCYLHVPPRLQPGYFSKFQQETLFYIFFSMPGDEAQLYAADELASRGWWFHKELKSWITRVPNTEPLTKSERYERGPFYVFDTQSWECVRRDSFALTYDSVERAPNLPRPGPQPGTGTSQGMQPPPPAPK
eukprot:scaffold15007_cov43-Prasinocladus_malaysianus.AAC.2